jgi:hypothetical protein
MFGATANWPKILSFECAIVALDEAALWTQKFAKSPSRSGWCHFLAQSNDLS